MRISDWSSDVCSSDLPLADVVVARQIVFAAPAVEVEIAPGPVRYQDRRGVAQPDVAERLDDHLGEGRGLARGGGGFVIGGDQQHRLALAVGVDRARKGDHFLAGGHPIVAPQFRMPRNADPPPLLPRPVGWLPHPSPLRTPPYT